MNECFVILCDRLIPNEMSPSQTKMTSLDALFHLTKRFCCTYFKQMVNPPN